MEQRYERAERELFARLEGVGREIENRVQATTTKLKEQALKTETAAVTGGKGATKARKSRTGVGAERAKGGLSR